MCICNLKSMSSFMRISLLAGVLCWCVGVGGYAQLPEKTEYRWKQETVPYGIENYMFAFYYYHADKVYNVRSVPLASVAEKVECMKVNPAGTTFAIIRAKGLKKWVEIYDLWEKDRLLHRFRKVENPLAICYSADARDIYIVTPTGLLCFDAVRTFEQKWSIDVPFASKEVRVSGNGYFLAEYAGTTVNVWNLEQKQIRKTFEFANPVNDVAFTKDSEKLGVLTDDGLLSIYHTKNFFIAHSFDAMGVARCLSFNPDGKYASVVTGDGRISVVNLLDTDKREYVDNEVGGMNSALFVRHESNHQFLIYNTQQDVICKLMTQLSPNYTKLLKDELAERMNEWMQQMPGESLADYNIRVNEESRMKQMKLFEEEIASRLASDNLSEMSSVSLGNYNPESGVLSLNFSSMPTIYLNVPESDVLSFNDTENLEFRNMRYGLTSKDNFELVYAEVYNNRTGKSYVFDNRERRSLEYLKADENFVPLELVQQSNMEQMKLEDIKETIVNLAKKENKISDHTNISVDAKVLPDVDANGNKIMNYKVNFTYTVEPQFSAHEDFAPGKYEVGESPAASAMLRIVKDAFEKDFSQYVKAGKKLKVNITGMADALPINGCIAYNGCYGDFEREPVYKNNELGNVTVTRKSGITENDQLAFLRATGVKEYIRSNVPALNDMDTDYVYNIEITKETGGAFRRIKVDFIFVDAF